MEYLAFRSSSYSGGSNNCVEVAPFHKSCHSGQGVDCIEVAPLPTDFRTSSHSAQDQNCLEVAPLSPSPGAALRDSKHPHLGHLAFPAGEWDGAL